VRSMVILAVLVTGAATSPAAQPQTTAEQVYKPGNGVTNPTLVKDVKPNYTIGAMQRRVQGMVGMSCVVQADGKVGECNVTRPLDAELDQEAVSAAKQWLFKPGTRDGEPVAVEVSLEMTFTLRDGPPVHRPGQGVSSPTAVRDAKPVYPEDVMRAGVQGSVELEGIVEVDGTIGNIRVTRSLDERLDAEAVKALEQWRFKPGQKDGQDVRVLISVEMSFSAR
jgi:TonB family protein